MRQVGILFGALAGLALFFLLSSGHSEPPFISGPGTTLAHVTADDREHHAATILSTALFETVAMIGVAAGKKDDPEARKIADELRNEFASPETPLSFLGKAVFSRRALYVFARYKAAKELAGAVGFKSGFRALARQFGPQSGAPMSLGAGSWTDRKVAEAPVENVVDIVIKKASEAAYAPILKPMVKNTFSRLGEVAKDLFKEIMDEHPDTGHKVTYADLKLSPPSRLAPLPPEPAKPSAAASISARAAVEEPLRAYTPPLSVPIQTMSAQTPLPTAYPPPARATPAPQPKVDTPPLPVIPGCGAGYHRTKDGCEENGSGDQPWAKVPTHVKGPGGFGN